MLAEHMQDPVFILSTAKTEQIVKGPFLSIQRSLWTALGGRELAEGKEQCSHDGVTETEPSPATQTSGEQHMASYMIIGWVDSSDASPTGGLGQLGRKTSQPMT